MQKPVYEKKSISLEMANKMIEAAKEKARAIDWNYGRRKEYYAIFARHFKAKKPGENLILYDLADLQKDLTK